MEGRKRKGQSEVGSVLGGRAVVGLQGQEEVVVVVVVLCVCVVVTLSSLNKAKAKQPDTGREI